MVYFTQILEEYPVFARRSLNNPFSLFGLPFLSNFPSLVSLSKFFLPGLPFCIRPLVFPFKCFLCDNIAPLLFMDGISMSVVGRGSILQLGLILVSHLKTECMTGFHVIFGQRKYHQTVIY